MGGCQFLGRNLKLKDIARGNASVRILFSYYTNTTYKHSQCRIYTPGEIFSLTPYSKQAHYTLSSYVHVHSSLSNLSMYARGHIFPCTTVHAVHTLLLEKADIVNSGHGLRLQLEDCVLRYGNQALHDPLSFERQGVVNCLRGH